MGVGVGVGLIVSVHLGQSHPRNQSHLPTIKRANRRRGGEGGRGDGTSRHINRS